MKEEGGVTPVPQAAQPEVQLRPLRPQALTSRPACLPFNGGPPATPGTVYPLSASDQ